MARLYGRTGLQAVRDWEARHLGTLRELLAAQEQFNLMVVGAIDDLKKGLSDKAS